MRATFRHFSYKATDHGLVVIPVNDPLTAGCWGAGEIDAAIALLKRELDDLGALMKAEAPKEHRKPLFGKA